MDEHGSGHDGWDDQSYRVETPERIDLEYDVAGLGSRFVGSLIDTTIQTIVVLLVATLGTYGLAYAAGLVIGFLGLSIDGETAGYAAIGMALLLGFAAFWGYYVFFELVWHGRSPGKRAAGLRVIKEGGYPIGFVDSAIRNVVRLIDFLPAYYILGALVMLVDSRSRRLGDLAAGTLVVKERRDVRLSTLGVGPSTATLTCSPGAVAPSSGLAAAGDSGDADEIPIPNLSRLTESDHRLLREYLVRRSSMAREAAAKLAATLAMTFARKLDYYPPDESADAFLARLARQASRGHRH